MESSKRFKVGYLNEKRSADITLQKINAAVKMEIIDPFKLKKEVAGY